MRRMIVKSTVSDDGFLRLAIPIGRDEARNEVQVTVESIGAAMSAEEWRAFILATAGSITDPSFERPPQGEFEVREALP